MFAGATSMPLVCVGMMISSIVDRPSARTSAIDLLDRVEVDSETRGEIRLRIHVDAQDAEALLRKGAGQVDGRCGLANTALLIRDRDHIGHGRHLGGRYGCKDGMCDGPHMLLQTAPAKTSGFPHLGQVVHRICGYVHGRPLGPWSRTIMERRPATTRICAGPVRRAALESGSGGTNRADQRGADRATHEDARRVAARRRRRAHRSAARARKSSRRASGSICSSTPARSSSSTRS